MRVWDEFSVHSRRILREARKSAEKVEWQWTRLEGDGIDLARKAVEAGSELVVAVGGDGTVNEVVNGLRLGRKLTGRDPVLGIVPVGTSCSLAKELGIPRGLGAAELAGEGAIRSIDLVRLRWMTPQGEQKERLATTITHFGFGGVVSRIVGRRLKRLGGFLGFAVGATLELFRYGGDRMAVEVDGRKVARSRLFSVIVANTRWEGGGMLVAPEARPDDGVLDVLVVEDMPLLSRLRNFPEVYFGTHVGLPFVASWSGRKVVIRGRGIVPFEFDGEWAECKECLAEVIPEMLKVLVPRRAAGF